MKLECEPNTATTWAFERQFWHWPRVVSEGELEALTKWQRWNLGVETLFMMKATVGRGRMMGTWESILGREFWLRGDFGEVRVKEEGGVDEVKMEESASGRAELVSGEK